MNRQELAAQSAVRGDGTAKRNTPNNDWHVCTKAIRHRTSTRRPPGTGLAFSREMTSYLSRLAKDIPMNNGSVQDAKARFRELLETCGNEGPQLVTRRGTEAAVLVPVREW